MCNLEFPWRRIFIKQKKQSVVVRRRSGAMRYHEEELIEDLRAFDFIAGIN